MNDPDTLSLIGSSFRSPITTPLALGSSFVVSDAANPAATAGALHAAPLQLASD
jgi:hypothetical protein